MDSWNILVTTTYSPLDSTIDCRNLFKGFSIKPGPKPLADGWILCRRTMYSSAA